MLSKPERSGDCDSGFELELVRQMATPDFDLELNLHRAMLGSAHKECIWKPESKVVRRFSSTVDAVSWKATSEEDPVPSEYNYF